MKMVRLAFGVEIYETQEGIWSGGSDLHSMHIWKAAGEWIGAIYTVASKRSLFSCAAADFQDVRGMMMAEQRRMIDAAREAERYERLAEEMGADASWHPKRKLGSAP